ncbi:MAG: sulfate transporter family protein [Rhodobiaceae bacterium]|nr:sulfate transporter family protein [Rhodobiaceae bacterium]MCC0055419.1 sulfate transporter family protein [Rhodobiaceae bacterium]
MIASALRAAGQLAAPEFRSVLLKTIGLTLLLLLALWGILQSVIGYFLADLSGWLDVTLSILSGLGLLVGAVFLIGPVSTLVAGLFLDDIADIVERTDYPSDRAGVAIPVPTAIWQAVKFFGVVIFANIVALLLLLLPGINLVAFLVVNGYLLGREFFELAAQRHRPYAEVVELRRQYGGQIFVAGLIIAGFMAIPILNLATPLFATAMMVHVHKRLTGSRPVSAQTVLPPHR